MKKKTNKLTPDVKIAKCEEFIKNFEDYEMDDMGPAYEQYGRRKYLIALVHLTITQQQIAN